MGKKLIAFILAAAISVAVGLMGFGVWHSVSNTPRFEADGYILQGDSESLKYAGFQSGDTYSRTLQGEVRFTDTEGNKTVVQPESFVHFHNGDVMALAGGTLVDFNDISDNFINNYYINEGLVVSNSNGVYTAETSNGQMKFGDHLWKLSDNRYIVQSPKIDVHMPDKDVREVDDFVQVVISKDGIAYLLTPENLWMTISPDCYLETASGVRVYPLEQLIDNGEFKMSLAKLSVSPDDAIVLTADETRRQIVPELNIEGIDGKDGDDGLTGEVGRIGLSGASGTEGSKGADGKEGKVGGDGSSGTSGSDGSNGDKGGDGGTGSTGKVGSTGGTGVTGASAIVESSINSALPTMSIPAGLNVSTTSADGTILIKDEANYLQFDKSFLYPGKITVTNVGTGEVIKCFGVDESDTFQFSSGDGSSVYFHCDGLDPDTQYRLSVVGYYKASMDDSSSDSEMIFSREFISRNFFTDSTGVTLERKQAATDSVTVSANVINKKVDSISRIQVYLLTPEQDKNFTIGSESYLRMVTLQDGIGQNNTVYFSNDGISEADMSTKGILPDTEYVARVYVEDTNGLKTLTTQRLDVLTLKQTPTYHPEDKTKATFNRQGGVFEVYRPIVTDKDAGIVRYIYTAYNAATNEKVSSQSLLPSAGEPVRFKLDPDVEYRFQVDIEFDDNEKTLFYSLGKSDPIKYVGANMPRLSLTVFEGGQEYDYMKGLLTIALDGDSSLDIKPGTPLRLEFFANQISTGNALELTTPNEAVYVNGNDDTLGTVTLGSLTENPNQVTVSLDLKSLEKNTNYSVSVYAPLDVQDGNGAVERALGNVEFHTYDTLSVIADWQKVPDAVTTLARKLTLTPIKDDGITDMRVAYADSSLKEGQVAVTLYSGIGAQRLKVGQKLINDPDEIQQLYTTGLLLTEESFNAHNISSGSGFTMVITDVTDGSYQQETALGFVNKYENIVKASETLTAEPMPPDLLYNSSGGIRANPILNRDAVSYGGNYSNILPDDAVVGFTLESTYSNDQRLAKSITYYAFEYNTFYNAFKGNADPINDDAVTKLVTVTAPVDGTSDSVPKVALFFGSGTDYSHGSWLVRYSGPANGSGSTLNEGMGRGYRYIFAYTVNYTSGGEDKVYPDDHPKNTANYRNVYPGGIPRPHGGENYNKNGAYVLQSPMCEAPLVMPEFHSYLANTTMQLNNETQSSGTAVLHYTWRDIEAAYNAANPVITDDVKLCYTNMDTNETVKVALKGDTGNLGSNWYAAEIPFRVDRSQPAELTPAIDVCAYYPNYDAVMREFYGSGMVDTKTYPICAVPLDFYYGGLFDSWYQKDPGTLKFTVKPLFDENNIRFVFYTSDPTVLNTFLSRALAVELTFVANDTNKTTKTFVRPLINDNHGYNCMMTTGELGNEFIGEHGFTLTSAKLIYDTGLQGWDYAERDQMAVQYAFDGGKAELSRYIGGSAAGGVMPANQALLKQTTNPKTVSETIRSTIGSSKDADKKVRFTYRSVLSDTYSNSLYLYPTEKGVCTSDTSDIRVLSERCIVPKVPGEISIFVDEQSREITLTKIVPTMRTPEFRVSSQNIGIDEMLITGLGEEGGEIFVSLFSSQSDAESFSNVIGTKKIIVKPDGTVESDGVISGTDITMTGLTQGKEYYIAFYCEMDGVKVHLLDNDTAMKAIYKRTCTDGATITVTDKEYTNKSYFDKEYQVTYNVTPPYNLRMRFNIYEDQACTKLLLSHDELTAKDASNLLSANLVPYSVGNTIKLDLMPKEARAKIKPGQKLYLQIQAVSATNEDSVEGSEVVELQINPVGSYGARAIVQGSTAASITWQITMNDKEYSFAGTEQGQGNAGLYAVRFTDKDDNLIKTTYDTMVFNAKEQRKSFTLDQQHIISGGFDQFADLKETEIYKVYIFALPDTDHDGMVNITGQPESYEKYFDPSVTNVENCGTAFNNLIDSFWDNNRRHLTSEVEAKILVGSSSARTIKDGGYYLDVNQVTADRQNDTTIRLIFTDSYALVNSSNKESWLQYIEWSVDGMTASTGEIVYESGTIESIYSLQEGKYGGYDIYYMDIPANIPKGQYNIILNMKENKGTQDPTKIYKVSIRSGV